MRFFRIFTSLLVVLLVTTSLSAASFSDQIRDWLPEFIAEWWWPEPEIKSILANEVASLPDATKFLELPRASNQNQDFHWPIFSIDPQGEYDKWRAAGQQAKLIQRSANLLPLAAGSSLRLISHQQDFPVYVRQYLQTFCLLHAINYEPEAHQSLISAANQGAINVLYADATRGTADLPVWLFDFMDQPAVLLWGGAVPAAAEFPSNWSVIALTTGQQAVEMQAAALLFQNESGKQEILTYGNPLVAGLDVEQLEKVDYHINRAIRRRASPGAQLLVAKNGQIVYQKAYGHHTYRRRQNVYTSDLYDLASITKAAATSLAVMYLYDQGKLSLSTKAEAYLPDLKGKPAGRHTVEQLLAHQTGLQSNIPIQQFLGKSFVRAEASEQFTVPISPTVYLDSTVAEKVIDGLERVNYTRRRIFRYSDLNYLILQQIVEKVDGRKLATLLDEEIYEPLGLTRLGFKPHEQFNREQCVPTSRDTWMRGGTVRGYVHDEGAALLGGIAGHAGLFGTATDLAQLFQMLLNKGSYNGQQIFRPETVELFTAKSDFNYRALGFDRLKGGWANVVKAGASEHTFGHTGFSGTCVWADPENELVFVLLTNRIHPDPKNDRLKKFNTRGVVHRQVYRSLMDEVADSAK